MVGFMVMNTIGVAAPSGSLQGVTPNTYSRSRTFLSKVSIRLAASVPLLASPKMSEFFFLHGALPSG